VNWTRVRSNAGFGISTVKLRILQDVPGFKVSTAVFVLSSKSTLENGHGRL